MPVTGFVLITGVFSFCLQILCIQQLFECFDRRESLFQFLRHIF